MSSPTKDPFEARLPADYMAQQYKEREQCRVIGLPHPNEMFFVQIDELRAEVERLKAVLASLAERSPAWRKAVISAMADHA